MRTARPLDVVNLYRLLSKQGGFDSVNRSDEARALVFVLDLILTGYVLVAENSAGRIVGSLGCSASRVRGRLLAQGQWIAVIPPYERTLRLDFLDMTTRAADHAGFAVRFPLSLPVDPAVMKRLGFKKTETEWTRKGKKNNGGAQSQVEDQTEAQHQ
jgi:hypothetical protein